MVSYLLVIKRKYEINLRSPKVRGVQIKELLSQNVQKPTNKVKFLKIVKAICNVDDLPMIMVTESSLLIST